MPNLRKPWRYHHSEELQIQLWQGRVCSAQGCIQVLLCSLTCGCQLPSWYFFLPVTSVFYLHELKPKRGRPKLETIATSTTNQRKIYTIPFRSIPFTCRQRIVAPLSPTAWITEIRHLGRAIQKKSWRFWLRWKALCLCGLCGLCGLWLGLWLTEQNMNGACQHRVCHSRSSGCRASKCLDRNPSDPHYAEARHSDAVLWPSANEAACDRDPRPRKPTNSCDVWVSHRVSVTHCQP